MSSTAKLSREEFRRQKDLDAARKAGNAPAEVDEEGREINPHIPQFISQAPWYLDSGRPSLKHQRKPGDGKERAKVGDWYKRGQTVQAATKYRKGACENCGAMSHKAKDCLERPRKKGAKWTGKNIAADEVFEDVSALDNDYESKRDRWNGYDPADHKRVMQEFEAVEEARRKRREEEIDQQTSTDMSEARRLAKKEKKPSGPSEDGDFGSSEDEDEDEDKYAEKANMPGQKIDTNKRITIRNLRIREDRAKYLYNLNPESSYYDPKTRSMREAPDANVRPEDAQYAGDNFHRARGETSQMQQLQLFAWQSESRGNDVHMQANPTVNELQHREYQQKKEKLRETMKGSILDRYGGAEHFDNVPKELLSGQSENYVEYSQTGQPLRPQSRILGSPHESKEDGANNLLQKKDTKEELYDGNHKEPFASWTDPQTGKSGYGCCHSTVKNSYCTGQAGIDAVEASNILLKKKEERAREEHDSKKKDEETKEKKRRRAKSSSSSSASSSYSDDSYSSSNESDEDNRRSGQKSPKSSKHRSSRRKRARSSSSSSYSSEDDGRRARTHAKGYRSKKDLGEGDVSSKLDKSRLKDALREEERRAKGEEKEQDESKKPEWLKEAEKINSKTGKKKYNSLKADDADVSEEQLEAYRMSRRNDYEDPMANYKDNDAGDVKDD